MKKLFLSFVTVMSVALFSVPAFATNGTNIIGVGAVSRSMGGVGTAAPQDAISAVFANPAAMCYIPCETSEVDFAGTVFVPTVKSTASITGGFINTGSFSAESEGQPYAFPAIGIYTPINDKWRFALAAYGVSGLGVDYKDSALANLFGPGAGMTDIRTQLAIMKFAPNVAYKVNDQLSVGAALQINWAQLDLGDGDSHDFGFGTQIGVLYKPVDMVSLGVTYQSAQNHEFERVADLDQNGTRDDLSLEQPHQVVVGAAVDVIPNMLLLEVDGKWLNWEGAEGYGDFGWEDQYVVAVGAQLKPMDKVAIRVGYNHGNNPVKDINGWDPGFASGATVPVQGKNVPSFFYHYLRNTGFPAIVEDHITAGVGINITPKVSVNLGYMHAFENEITSTSAVDGTLDTVTLRNSLDEDSFEFGLNIMF